MLHLSIRMLNLEPVLRDYTIVITWGQMVEGEKGRGKAGSGMDPHVCKTASWEIIKHFQWEAVSMFHRVH